MTSIFISYRREDARHAAGRLVDRLEQTFRKDQLFFDVDNIAPGLDFREVLSEKVAACDVLLSLIGPNWANATDADGKRRLDNPKDFVRIELEAALARGIRVVPVLVDGAEMPREDQLPESLHPLCYRHAVRLTHERFGADADGLTRTLVTAKSGERPNKMRAEIPQSPSLNEFAAWMPNILGALSLGLAIWLQPSEIVTVTMIFLGAAYVFGSIYFLRKQIRLVHLAVPAIYLLLCVYVVFMALGINLSAVVHAIKIKP